MAQFIRPALRTTRGCYTAPRTLTPEDRQRLLRSTPPKPKRVREWTPPTEYLMVARGLHPEIREAYVTRCEEWFAARADAARIAREPRRETVDTEAVAALVTKYGAHVPISEYRRVGYSEEALEKVRTHREWMESHEDELQAEIERRWPGSSKPKAKKVIKAVKKKMT